MSNVQVTWSYIIAAVISMACCWTGYILGTKYGNTRHNKTVLWIIYCVFMIASVTGAYILRKLGYTIK